MTWETRLVRALVRALVAAQAEVKAAEAALDEAFKDGHSHVDHETQEDLLKVYGTAKDRLAVLDEIYAAALADDPLPPGRFGAAGLRDPEHPCKDYEPGDRRPAADCETDGHCLCSGCRHAKVAP